MHNVLVFYVLPTVEGTGIESAIRPVFNAPDFAKLGGFCARKNGLYGFFRFSGPTIYGVYPVFGRLRGSANFEHGGSSHCSRSIGNSGQTGRLGI